MTSHQLVHLSIDVKEDRVEIVEMGFKLANCGVVCISVENIYFYIHHAGALIIKIDNCESPTFLPSRMCLFPDGESIRQVRI